MPLSALSINMMLGYGGMVSLGHAAYLGIAGYACILATLAGYNQLVAAVFAIALSTAAAAFFGVLSLRAPGLGFIMITLALGQIVWGIAYRANDLTGGDNGIRLPGRPMPFGIDITLHRLSILHLDRACGGAVCIWRFVASLRRESHGYARSTPPHAHARPPRVARALDHVRGWSGPRSCLRLLNCFSACTRSRSSPPRFS
jgi:branched-chain amino acid transport system permease protein